MKVAEQTGDVLLIGSEGEALSKHIGNAPTTKGLLDLQRAMSWHTHGIIRFLDHQLGAFKF